MMVFLIGVLGRGGTAEGVVVGMLAAWGAATLVDVEPHPARWRPSRGAATTRPAAARRASGTTWCGFPAADAGDARA